MADGGNRWYFSRKEIEENSPSRRDGIDLKEENYFRRSYSCFLRDLGMKLFVPPVTTATATVFCHRFFLRQSHAKHDRFKIATACMYLALKVEGNPMPLWYFVVTSFQIIHKKDPKAYQNIITEKEEVYEEHKDIMLQEEKLVVKTLESDFNICHPYVPLLEAIKKLKGVANEAALTQVAWNFVNDGFLTSLSLQMNPQKVAASALFLAAKFLKIQLQWDGQNSWWQEFSITQMQLEDACNQLLELYEQVLRAPTPRASQDEASGEEALPAPLEVLASVKNANSSDSSANQLLELHEQERALTPRASQGEASGEEAWPAPSEVLARVENANSTSSDSSVNQLQEFNEQVFGALTPRASQDEVSGEEARTPSEVLTSVENASSTSSDSSVNQLPELYEQERDLTPRASQDEASGEEARPAPSEVLASVENASSTSSDSSVNQLPELYEQERDLTPRASQDEASGEEARTPSEVLTSVENASSTSSDSSVNQLPELYEQKRALTPKSFSRRG